MSAPHAGAPDRGGSHRCPRPGCTRTVPNRFFACHRDWFTLSQATRLLIYATAHLHVMDPERRAAFRAADADWARAAS